MRWAADQVMDAVGTELNFFAPKAGKTEQRIRGFIDDPERTPIKGSAEADYENKNCR